MTTLSDAKGDWPMATRRDAPSADLRRDHLTGATSLVVPSWETSKAADPAPLALEMPSGTTPCPFCPGQMDDPRTRAGEETARVGGDGSPRSWSAISLLNRWPHTLDATAAEVVVLSADHDAHLGTMSTPDAALAFDLLLDRAASQRERGLYPLVFVNHGVNAGSSQPHPHGQVIGLPSPDPLSVAEAPALLQAGCVLCQSVPEERLVAQLSGAAVIMPEAPGVDYDQLVVLTRHGEPDAYELAEGVGTALRALRAVRGPVAYNIVVHLDAHPHVHVTPRTVRHSGYELVGIATCYVDPQIATARLADAAELAAAPSDTAVTGDRSHGDRRSDAA